ncbi:MAG: hypothetical protein HY295_02125 [Thaumarchaeota archaeon]|nr:hypothetical protein [Nitrososphaerota archaeon]
MDFEKTVNEILSLDDAMRYVRIIDKEGKIVHERTKSGKTLLQNREGLGKISVDMTIMKETQGVYDDSLGRMTHMHIVRERVHQLIYFADSLIFYVTCERDTPDQRVFEISSKAGSIIGTYVH